jgi:hypothetical protein
MSGATAGQDPPLISSVRYEDLSVGQRWGPFKEWLSADTSDRLRGAMGTRSAGEAAPPGVLPVLSLRAMRRALRGIPAGGVLVRQRFAAFGPLAGEGDVGVDVRLVGQQRRTSGLYTTFVFAFFQDGSLAATAEWMILAPPLEPGEAGT